MPDQNHRTFYLAGPLFDLKELAGNAQLAAAIYLQSGGNYEAVLPQNLSPFEPPSPRAIRDTDLLALLSADLALFHFDGPELDSGTVAEFMLAKFADIPSVLLRSDFRRAGDSCEEPWNLMLSGYPRVETIVVSALQLYQDARSTEASPIRAAERAVQVTAGQIVQAFRKVERAPAALPNHLRSAVYRWLALFPGFAQGGQEEQLTRILEGKITKKLL